MPDRIEVSTKMDEVGGIFLLAQYRQEKTWIKLDRCPAFQDISGLNGDPAWERWMHEYLAGNAEIFLDGLPLSP